MSTMLEITNLTKTYGNRIQALKGINLSVSPGMFGLLGPNGSGKTTLMKIMATLLAPDSGTIEMRGVNLVNAKPAARRMLGYLPQEFGLYPSLTAEQTLDYLARLKGVWDGHERRTLVGALLERVNLSTERKQKVGGFSGGMRQRLGIAQALIGAPDLIIVDEPTAGLDPEERVRFHNLLSEAIQENTVIILSTHIVSDVSNLCSQMAVIRKGKILAATRPEDAVAQLRELVWEATVSREKAAALKENYKVISSQVFGGQTRLRFISKVRPPGDDFVSVIPTLEDYYLNLVSQTN